MKNSKVKHEIVANLNVTSDTNLYSIARYIEKNLERLMGEIQLVLTPHSEARVEFKLSYSGNSADKRVQPSRKDRRKEFEEFVKNAQNPDSAIDWEE